jgi:hypothetical protein
MYTSLKTTEHLCCVCVFYEQALPYLTQCCHLHFCPGTETTAYICSQQKMNAWKVRTGIYLRCGIVDILYPYGAPFDRLCSLVIRVPGYRSRGPRIDSRHHQNFWVVGLKRGTVSIVSTTEELIGRKSSGSGLESVNTAVGIHCVDHVIPPFHKSWN